jgi:hypothetical protein
MNQTARRVSLRRAKKTSGSRLGANVFPNRLQILFALANINEADKNGSVFES